MQPGVVSTTLTLTQPTRSLNRTLTTGQGLQQTLVVATETQMEIKQEAEDKKHKKYEEREVDAGAALAAIFALLEEPEEVGNGKTRGKRLREADFS